MAIADEIKVDKFKPTKGYINTGEIIKRDI